MTTSFERLWAGITGRRGYRFEGEQENHTQQARETQTSLGILAAHAQPSDDAGALQRMLSERTLRDRLNGLLALKAARGLTEAEDGEKASIEMGLASLEQPVQGASAPRRFLGPLMAANPLAGVLMSPALWVAAAFAIPAAGAAIQTARLHHAKSDLTQARHDLAAAVAAAHGWEERAEQYRHGLIDAANVAHQAAAALDAERAAQARAAARERRRNRELANVLAHSPDAPAWRLRDDEPPADQPTAPTP